MVAKNPLLEAPPYPVEQALKRLGENLRLARTRRKLTIEEVAEKIGTGPRAVMDAEKGRPSTAHRRLCRPACGSMTSCRP